MKIRLTNLDLRLDGHVRPVGEVLVVGVDIPVDLAQRRLAGQTAELVVDGEAITPAIDAALAALDRAALATLTAMTELLDLVEVEPPAVALAVVEALTVSREQSEEAGQGLAKRIDRLHQAAAEARHAIDLVQGGAAPADLDNPAENGGVGGAAAEASAAAAKPKRAAKAKTPAADPGGGA